MERVISDKAECFVLVWIVFFSFCSFYCL